MRNILTEMKDYQEIQTIADTTKSIMNFIILNHLVFLIIFN